MSENKLLNDLQMIQNVMTSRASLLRQMTSERRDYNKELDYPDVISSREYNELFERSDIAEKVVTIYPDECWGVEPLVQETDDNEQTEFEEAWTDLVDSTDILYNLWRADVQSGIGSYGVLLLGVSGSDDLLSPLPGLSGTGRPATSQNRELIYTQAFPEHLVEIDSFEGRKGNPRFMLPNTYNIKLTSEDAKHGSLNLPLESIKVHWSRVIHLADNRGASRVYGVPRMRSTFNRLRDLRKILGGSGEMFWKGAFPGYTFEVNPEFVAAAGLDSTTAGAEFKHKMREEFWNFSEGLQRYMALLGVSAKSLAPQVASPDKHVRAMLEVVAATIGVPFRIFMGSEQGSLASSQDLRTWNRKLRKRQQRYLTPLVIRPLIDRLIAVGVLPAPKEKIGDKYKYKVMWPDLDIVSEHDKADVADKLTTALQKFVTSKMEMLIPPKEYFVRFLGLTPTEADIIVNAAKLHRPEVMEQVKEMQEIMAPPQPEGVGGAGNQNPNTSGGNQPRNPAAQRSRSASGASRSTNK